MKLLNFKLNELIIDSKFNGFNIKIVQGRDQDWQVVQNQRESPQLLHHNLHTRRTRHLHHQKHRVQDLLVDSHPRLVCSRLLEH